MVYTYSVPWYLVRDDRFKTAMAHAAKCPWYEVHVTKKWEGEYQRGTEGVTLTFNRAKGKGTSSEESEERAKSVNFAVSIGASAGIGVVEVGGDVTVGAEFSISHARSRSEESSTEFSFGTEVPLQEGQNAAVWWEPIVEYEVYCGREGEGGESSTKVMFGLTRKKRISRQVPFRWVFR